MSFVEPWFIHLRRDVFKLKYQWRDETSLIYHQSTRKKHDWVFAIPNFGQISMILRPYQVSDLISQDIGTVNTASDWLVASLGVATQDNRTVKWPHGNLLHSKKYSFSLP